MGTEKTSELSYVVLRLAESGQLAQLTRLILDVEAIMEKYKRLEEAARRITQPVDWANYDKRVALVKAVDDLEQE